MKWPVVVLLCVFTFISLLIIIVRCIGDKFQKVSVVTEKETFDVLLDMEDLIRKKTYSEIRSLIVAENRHKDLYSNCQIKSPLSNRRSRTNSVHKINLIIDQATIKFAERFGCEGSDVNISLIYKKDKSSKWEILAEKNLNEGEHFLERIVNSDISTFNCVLREPDKFEFILDKDAAYRENRYMKTVKEINQGAKGSIYCKNLSVYSNDNSEILKGFVLCIGTREKAFCGKDQFSRNICTRMFNILEGNIKNELINLFLIEHMGFGGI